MRNILKRFLPQQQAQSQAIELKFPDAEGQPLLDVEQNQHYGIHSEQEQQQDLNENSQGTIVQGLSSVASGAASIARSACNALRGVVKGAVFTAKAVVENPQYVWVGAACGAWMGMVIGYGDSAVDRRNQRVSQYAKNLIPLINENPSCELGWGTGEGGIYYYPKCLYTITSRHGTEYVHNNTLEEDIRKSAWATTDEYMKTVPDKTGTSALYGFFIGAAAGSVAGACLAVKEKLRKDQEAQRPNAGP